MAFRRRSRVSVSDKVPEYSKILTEFQIDKLRHLFMVMFKPTNPLQTITEKDMMAWVERIRVFSSLKPDSQKHVRNQDVHRVFYDALREQLRLEKASLAENIPKTWEEARNIKIQVDDVVSITSWLNMWAKLLHFAKGLEDLPIWVQYLPDIIYDTIDTDASTYLEEPELLRYYKNFLGTNIDETQTHSMHKAMAVNGEAVLNRAEFRMNYANFLLCRNKVGAGKYVFGLMEGALVDLEE